MADTQPTMKVHVYQTSPLLVIADGADTPVPAADGYSRGDAGLLWVGAPLQATVRTPQMPLVTGFAG